MGNDEGTAVERGRARWIAPSLMAPRPTEIGKIKIGRKVGPARQSASGGEWRRPTKLDHFIVTTRTRGTDGNFVRDDWVHRPESQGGLGEKPTELPVRLMYDEPTENLQSSMVQYDGRTRVAECDGIEVRNLQTGECSPCLLAAGGKCNCKPYARLSVILEAGRYYGGFHVFRTTSWESTRNLQTALGMFHTQFGILAGLRLSLVLYPATVEYQDGDGNRRSTTAYMVTLVMRGGFDEAAQLAAEAAQYKLGTMQQRKLLAAATVEMLDSIDEAEGAELAEEFWPPDDIAGDDEGELVDAAKGPSKVERQREQLAARAREVAGIPNGAEIAEDESMSAPEGYRVLKKHGGWLMPQVLDGERWASVADKWTRDADEVLAAIDAHREPGPPEVEVVPACQHGDPDNTGQCIHCGAVLGEDEGEPDELERAKHRMVEASGHNRARASHVAYGLFKGRDDIPRTPAGLVSLGDLSAQQLDELSEALESEGTP